LELENNNIGINNAIFRFNERIIRFSVFCLLSVFRSLPDDKKSDEDYILLTDIIETDIHKWIHVLSILVKKISEFEQKVPKLISEYLQFLLQPLNNIKTAFTL